MKDNLFGKNLKNLRLSEGLSQRALGERLGVCNQTVSFWESGSREPDLDILVKLAEVFNVSVDLLLCE
mgnify:CR=1 FL=1